MASTETVKLLWKCCLPNDGATVELCESLMIKSALQTGSDTAIVRQEPHHSLFKYGYHLTGFVVDNATKTSFAVHWRVTDPPAPGVSEALPDLPNSPNPVIWPVDYAKTLVGTLRTRSEIQAEKLARSIVRGTALGLGYGSLLSFLRSVRRAVSSGFAAGGRITTLGGGGPTGGGGAVGGNRQRSAGGRITTLGGGGPTGGGGAVGGNGQRSGLISGQRSAYGSGYGNGLTSGQGQRSGSGIGQKSAHGTGSGEPSSKDFVVKGDVFVNSESTLPFLMDALKAGAKALWTKDDATKPLVSHFAGNMQEA
ncbi:hypothetical protein C8J55DRAFT_553448 [Lentinula edodes]|uniref:Uncharacterized protein n=1 Tax=Lentinula lateritia TaxID=40482 RepID=A0A9W9E1X7_9AGAR|nr:hypothetical protein C8J55DRAFT_553448 [Lentinula edodes]